MGPKQAIAHISKVHISKVLLLSYVVDWVFIVGVALIGYGFYKESPNQHPFSLSDPTISYPYDKKETVSTKTLILVSLLAPAAIILIGAWTIVPGTAAPAGIKPSTAQVLRRNVWMSTQGLKVLVGKPRPDLLDRCKPDLSKITDYMVGGLGTHIQDAPILVTWGICQVKTNLVKIDGFSSFPSGHASFSFAGLGYLTLWFAAKLSIGFPYLSVYPVKNETHTDDQQSARKRGAAPPVLLMVLAFVPTATACFIAASRWANCRHHGFDVLFGSAMGIFFAFIGFRMYHLPIQRGAGWAWGPRSPHRAFIRGLGFPSSLGTDSWTYSSKGGDQDSCVYREDNAIENGASNGNHSQLPMAERA
ncbi:hypothetical protein N7468_008743 [Penicillium chermesinum]|uniref:Phosphatidic acid phosphatase type 2/haloperoxidase domain-containing protein n=1 Tax=Penicillium chermesinum TaxID=63820 RepID=A0A9W9NGI4_9EURO|nr:uncharacterized protein N7468_008743 [Penicillium chermesinum]KAJ5219539.1 hypothetical protein N7468_008743 [Penicillium chermesinum]